MIVDRLENAKWYARVGRSGGGVGGGVGEAMEFLRETNFSKVADGKVEIDGERMFAFVQRYATKEVDEAKWEAHRKYVDVQYVADGAERMGYAALADELPVAKSYDEESDLVFYETAGDLVTVEAGGFAVFWPWDVHAPGLVVVEGGSDDVLKVVVKCRME